MRGLILSIVSAITLVECLHAEDYFPPVNVVDPLAKPEKRSLGSDSAIPFIYLEPHNFSFDRNDVFAVTIFAVNRSDRKVSLDWESIYDGLRLETVGPGKVVYRKEDRKRLQPIEVEPQSCVNLFIDLKNRYEIHGPGVFRLSFQRALPDGRLHVSGVVQFVVEDYAALDVLIARSLPKKANLQTKAALLLKSNPMLAEGVIPKTFGWDSLVWPRKSAMQTEVWAKRYADAHMAWLRCIPPNDVKDAETADLDFLELLIDRLFELSGGNALPDRTASYLLDYVRRVGTNRAHFKLYLKLAHFNHPVSQGCCRILAEANCVDVLPLIQKHVDSPLRELRLQAVESIGRLGSHPEGADLLRRKMTDSDPEIALSAASTLTFYGDGKNDGFRIMLRMLYHDDPKIREKASVSVGGVCGFIPIKKRLVPELGDLLSSVKEPDFINAVLYTLSTIADPAVFETVRPFLKHPDESVRKQAQMALDDVKKIIDSQSQDPKKPR